MRTHQAVPEAPGLSCTDPHLAEVILDAAVPRRPLDAHVHPGAERVLLVQEVEGEDAPRGLGVILAAAWRREELGALRVDGHIINTAHAEEVAERREREARGLERRGRARPSLARALRAGPPCGRLTCAGRAHGDAARRHRRL